MMTPEKIIEDLTTEVSELTESNQIWSEVAERVVKACNSPDVTALVHVVDFVSGRQREK